MTPIEDVYTMSADTIMNEENIQHVSVPPLHAGLRLTRRMMGGIETTARPVGLLARASA
jgi:hypothetical protein